MDKPCTIYVVLFRAAVLASAILFIFNPHIDLRAQQTVPESNDTARGIELYRQGETIKAIEALTGVVKHHKDDADAWHYLGLALNRAHKPSEAREAFEHALKLRPDFAAARSGLAYDLFVANKSSEAEKEAKRALIDDSKSIEAHYIISAVQLQCDKCTEALKESEAAIKINPRYAPALLLKIQSFVCSTNKGIRQLQSEASRIIVGEEENQTIRTASRQFFSQAASSLQQYLRLIPNDSAATRAREQLEKLQIYAHDESVSDKQSTLFLSSEVDTKAVILSTPLPEFAKAAKELGANRVVIVRAVLDSSGAIRWILVTKSPDYVFTEAATNAAREIQFTPAIKNGRAVSQMVTIIYGYVQLNKPVLL